MNDNYFGISNEFWLSVFVVEPSSNHFFSPRRSSIESFGYYHFLRVDDYGAAAHATKPARLRLVVSALVAEARLVFGACHFLARGTPVPSAYPADFHAPADSRFGAIKPPTHFDVCACIPKKHTVRYRNICTS